MITGAARRNRVHGSRRPEVLDPALLRLGRFDRQVVIPLPAQPERRAILAVRSRSKPLESTVDLRVVARATPGFSGAGLANLVNDSLAIRMGGLAAERLVFGLGSTSAADDLAGATDLATRMVREYGMSRALGPVGFRSGSPLYLGGEEVKSRPYAEATQRLIDEGVAKLLREAEERAAATLTEHRAALDRLTELLLERETVDGTDVDEIIGRLPRGREPVGATAATTRS